MVSKECNTNCACAFVFEKEKKMSGHKKADKM